MDSVADIFKHFLLQPFGTGISV